MDLNGAEGKKGGSYVPKRIGYLYKKMEDEAMIRLAIQKGAKGKKKRKDVKEVLVDVDKYVELTRRLIVERRYIPTKPRPKEIYDPCSQKIRSINIVPFFPDGIMHQLLVMTMEPVLMRGMYQWSCASVPGRGTKLAKQKAERIIKGDVKGTKYGAELDVKGYYPSIPVANLINALMRKIKDREFLLMVAVALLSYPGGMPAALAHPLGVFGVVGNARGICIGFYLCQWLANYYLETLDWFAVKQPGVKYMIRYMDNISLFGPNKKQLHKARAAIATFMKEKLGLTMKGNWQVFPISKRPFSIVGYRVSRTWTILRKRNFLRLSRQCRRVKKRLAAGKQISYKAASGLLSRIGQLKHCNGRTVREKYIAPIGTEILKEVIRNESTRKQGSQQRFYAGAPT